MKFILFVEGHTENKVLPNFLKRWLDPKLTTRIGISTVRFEGWPELVKDAPLKARMHLGGPRRSEIIAVIALLDLYGPTFYPDHLQGRDERYDWAKKDMEDRVNQPKFFQFFAVHEVEAWGLDHRSGQRSSSGVQGFSLGPVYPRLKPWTPGLGAGTMIKAKPGF